MRVIKENKIEKKHKCSNCKSIFGYLPGDINPYVYPTVKCPVCGRIDNVSIFDRKVKEK